MKEYEQEEKNESVAHEPELEYLASPTLEKDELDFENDEDYDQIMDELEAVFAEDRIEHAIRPIPEGYMSLEDFDKLLEKKLWERYAKL